MHLDLFGNPRQKVAAHVHTTRSDGHVSPEQAAEIYRAAGFDAIALTDHWTYGAAWDNQGMQIFSGAEYNIGGGNAANGVFHIVGIGMEADPQLINQNSGCLKDSIAEANHAAQAITQAGGIAVLAHPAWSVNTPEMIRQLDHIAATEIYNTVSAVHESNRADSSDVIDMMATEGWVRPLLAVDDTHYYDGTDECKSFIMVQAEHADVKSILAAIQQGLFYASQGPEIHIVREDSDVIVRCSPVCEIGFYSNTVWTPNRMHRGDGLTEAVYHLQPADTFIRAKVRDAQGKCAWTNILAI